MRTYALYQSRILLAVLSCLCVVRVVEPSSGLALTGQYPTDFCGNHDQRNSLYVLETCNMYDCHFTVLSPSSLLSKGVPAGALPLVPGCISECTHPFCPTLLTTYWIPFFVLETSKLVLSH
jgi:hypothetical protein